MSDTAIDAALTAIAALFTGLSGGFAFLGAFRDETKLQSKWMTKKALTAEEAAKKVETRRKWYTGFFIAAWAAGIGVGIAAVLATLYS